MYRKQFDHQWTHQLFNTHERRQIDFVLIDRSKRCVASNAHAIDSFFAESDHRPVVARLECQAPRTGRRKQTARKAIGWQIPDGDDDATAQYHQALDALLDQLRDPAPDTVTQAIVDIAAEHGVQRDRPDAIQGRLPDHIKRLEQMRRHEKEVLLRQELSKQISAEIRKFTRFQHDKRLDDVIRKRQGKRGLEAADKRKSRRIVGQMVDAEGNETEGREEAAEVFAQFYEKLYQGRHVIRDVTAGRKEQAEVSRAEVEGAVESLKKGKTCADDGLVAEMLQSGSQRLMDTLATLFTRLLRNDMETPDSWKASTFVVIMKEGDVRLPRNYRPIAMLPVLYKVFAKVLVKRLRSTLDDVFDVEQAARSGMSCCDHVHTLVMVSEKAAQWGETVWSASLDVEKAYDTVSHDMVLKSLERAGVDQGLVSTIAHIYEGLTATVDIGAWGAQP